jgi:hypothetical protein
VDLSSFSGMSWIGGICVFERSTSKIASEVVEDSSLSSSSVSFLPEVGPVWRATLLEAFPAGRLFSVFLGCLVLDLGTGSTYSMEESSLVSLKSGSLSLLVLRFGCELLLSGAAKVYCLVFGLARETV